MKTYFKWQEPKGFTRKECKESFRRSFRPLLRRFILGVVLIGFIIFASHFAALNRVEHMPLFSLFAATIACGILIYTASPFIALLVFKIFTTTKRIKVSEKGVHAVGDNCVSWHYQDIQRFQIKQEQIENETIDVLELKNFDGRIRTFGLAPEIPKDELSGVISERIAVAQERMKKSVIGRGFGWRSMTGLFLVCCGLICLLAIHAVSSDEKIAEKRARKIDTEVVRIANRLEAEQLSEEHKGALEEIIKLSVSINVELVHWIKILMGISIASSVVLLGGVLLLWDRNKLLSNKIARLEVYWSDMFENGGTEQES
jgi:hypothetical protein